jgi:hypothetical protein
LFMYTNDVILFTHHDKKNPSELKADAFN